MRLRVLSLVGVAAAGLLFVQLSGTVGWLPRPSVLTGLLAAALAGRALVAGPPVGRRLREHAFAAGLAGVFVLALAVRLPHLSGDLWHAPIDVDEHRLSENVRQFFLTGTIGHETVEHYPGVVFWMLTAASLVAYVLALLQGTIQSLPDMPVEMFTLASRLTNAVVGSATAVLTGLLGRELGGARAGLLAGGFVAVVPLAVDTTTLTRNDPGQALFLVAAVYAALVAERGNGRSTTLVAAAALAGLATAIKYTSVFALPAVLLVALFRRGADRWTGVATALGVFSVAVAVSNHFVWADFPNFLRQISDQVAWGGPRQTASNSGADRTGLLAADGPGLALLVLGAAHGAWRLGVGDRRAWVFWVFPLAYAWLTTLSAALYPRWVYQLVPFAAAGGATGLAALLGGVSGWRGWAATGRARWRGWALAALTIVAIAQPCWAGLVSVSRRMRTPTYALVEAWLVARSAGATILAERGTLDFEGTPARVVRVARLRDALDAGDRVLCAVDWVVVPEFERGQRALGGLTRALEVRAGTGFMSRMGMDYDVYATPRVTDAARCAGVSSPEASR